MKMRGLIVFGLTLGLVMASVGIAMADFSQVSRSTTTAEAVITAGPTGTMSVEVRDLDGTTVTTQVNWDSSAIVPGTTKWLCATQLLYVTCDYTGGGIQIYTDNTADDAAPKWDGVGDPKNLLRYETGLSTSTAGLPMCWRTPFGLLDPAADETLIEETGDHHLVDPASPLYYCWLWMADRGAGGFVDGGDYVTIWRKDQGCQHAEYTWDLSCPLKYVYIGANFADAMALTTYRTTTLRLELYSL